ncbi:hypothetical protein [Paracoccus alkanivorans]|uniref:Uncharacterized protein n=1 Tax=Paracoccus alkanivorans TaxID=2116655 RepID=A0A3M0M617_9RHOB|nr:hypothetical protein [Paracoccus alkanivorans]RMC33228.1 hypothetical protein C9E81_16980 [Paracoccus alkanivorans]
MIGVVIWDRKESESAVIWCEDQASLVYLEGRDQLRDPSYWPRPGDLVELEDEVIGKLRHARHVSHVPQEKGGAIPQELRCPYNPDCTSLAFPVCDYTCPPCKARCG